MPSVESDKLDCLAERNADLAIAFLASARSLARDISSAGILSSAALAVLPALLLRCAGLLAISYRVSIAARWSFSSI